MNKFLFYFIFISTFSIAQPKGYYSSAAGSRYTLKTQLFKIINNTNDGLNPEYLHIDRGYGSGTSTTNNGLWTAYGTTDSDNGIGYENDNTIVDIYTENPSGADFYNFNYNTAGNGNSGQCGNYSGEGDCYNREHLIPQSYFGSTGIMRNDVHHVYPTDGKVNSIHDNLPFGKVGSNITYTSSNGTKRGNALNSGYSAGYSGEVFEPIDEFKGDIARVYLYFATRYESQMDDFYAINSGAECKVMFDGSIDKVFSTTFLRILLTWNAMDPVSTKETVRNNACFVFQNNRNPYIDHPEYVSAIWGSLGLEDIEYQKTDLVDIYPTLPKDNKIFIKQLSDKKITSIFIYSSVGQLIDEVKNTSNQDVVEVQMPQKQGIYFVKVVGGGMEVNRQIIMK